MRAATGAAAGEVVEIGDGLGEGERVVARVDQVEQDRAGDVAGFQPDFLRFVAVEDFDLVGVLAWPGESMLGRRAGMVHQRQSQVGHQLAEPRLRFAQPVEQERAGFGSRRGEARQRVEERRQHPVGDVGDRRLGAPVKIDGEPDQRRSPVDVGADIDGGRHDLHGAPPLLVPRVLARRSRGRKRGIALWRAADGSLRESG